MDINTEQTKYYRAKKRVDEIKDFYGNLISYIIIIPALAGINYWMNEWSYMWFLWAAFGWGIGVLFHAIGTFNMNPFLGKGWEKRKLKELMDKDNKL